MCLYYCVLDEYQIWDIYLPGSGDKQGAETCIKITWPVLKNENERKMKIKQKLKKEKDEY